MDEAINWQQHDEFPQFDRFTKNVGKIIPIADTARHLKRKSEEKKEIYRKQREIVLKEFDGKGAYGLPKSNL